MPYFQWEDEQAIANAAVTAHEAAADPHPAYLTQAEADALYEETGTIEIVNQSLGNSATTLDVFPRIRANQGSAFDASGRVVLTYFTPLTTLTVSEVTAATAGTAASGVTAIRMGLYTVANDGSLTLVARTASDATLFNSTFSLHTRSFDTADGYPATYQIVAGTRYAFGIFISATGLPVLFHNGASMTALTALAPRISGQLTGQTDLPATASSITNINRLYWGRFS